MSWYPSQRGETEGEELKGAKGWSLAWPQIWSLQEKAQALVTTTGHVPAGVEVTLNVSLVEPRALLSYF
jgi:hypothetical protein